jgi:anti-anti-sigma factor
MTSFPDIQIRMDDLAVEGDRATYHWTLTGTQSGPGGKGNRVRISGVESWKIGADGLIAESLGKFDNDSYQRQITRPAGSGRLALDIVPGADMVIVRCSGKLVAGENDFFYKEISSLIPTTKKIVLDLTDLTHMDSMGLGGLVRVSVSTKMGHCELELVNLGKRIRELLGITHLLSAFTICGEHSFRMS